MCVCFLLFMHSYTIHLIAMQLFEVVVYTLAICIKLINRKIGGCKNTIVALSVQQNKIQTYTSGSIFSIKLYKILQL